MSERIDTAALLARTDIVAVVGSFVALKKAGKEFSGLCPFHGEKTPSFTVIPDKHFAHCFGCGWSGDAIKFLQEVEGIEFRAACERLGADTEWKPNIVQRPKPPTLERITSKPPKDAGVPNMAMRELGEPSKVWTYRDADGDPLGYVARYDVGSNGSRRKEIRVWSWGRRGDQPDQWACGHWTRPERPLYGLDRLAARPDDPVILPEGEKACDAAAQLLPQYVAVTWPGGVQAIKHVDFRPLAGRRLLLWPDADEVGRECMASLARLLGDPRGLACDPVKLVDVSDWSDGRDLADCLAEDWTPDQVMEWAGPRVKVYAAPQQNPEADQVPEQEGPAAEPLAKPKRKRKSRPATEERFDGDEGEDNASAAALSEDDLAEQFAEKHAERWRYVQIWGKWFQYRNDGWYQDDIAEASRLMIEVCRAALYRPEARELSGAQKKMLGRKNMAWNARDMAATHRKIAARADQWDQNRALIGVPGGVLDLEISKLIGSTPEQYITKRTSVAPAPGRPETWLKFLDTVMGGNADLIAYLQRFAGYCLTGENREQQLTFLYGTGQNGKGVFLTTLSNILGDYARSAGAEVFMSTDNPRHLTERARMRGARLVTVDETDSSARWNEALIKRITGGGKMEANFMRQDLFEFEPEFKLLVAGNHKPQLRGVGKAIQRRFHLVPFAVTIPDEERDDKLPEKLRAEYPQILQWMLEGCAAWRDYGLAPPEEIRDATAAYIQGEDTLGEWIEECTIQSGEVSRPVAYKQYFEWIKQRGERAWSSKAWWAALEERGFTVRRSSAGRFINLLSLKATAQTSDGPPAWHNYDSDR